MSKKLISGLLFLALALPGTMHAVSGTTHSGGDYSTYSIEKLEALIRDLQKQIEELKKGSMCSVPSIDLSIGDGEGDDLSDEVKQVQEVLYEKGFMTTKSTGYFGKITRAALVKFQTDNSISSSGAFDEATRQKMRSMNCSKVAKSTEKPKEAAKENKPVQTSTLSSISLSNNGNKVSWTTVGSSPQGYKLVWGKSPNPVYPTRDTEVAQYYSSSEGGWTHINAFKGPGTYYVRLCQYTGSSCDIYSNELSITLE